MPTTNFLPWDQPQTNMETDPAYASDAQRNNGGAVGAAFPSATFNKFGLQASGMAYALAEFLVSKGFTIQDSNLPAITSALQTLFANVPGRSDLQSVTYAPSVVCDASLYNGFEILLAGNITISVINRTKGQELTFQLVQGGGGGFTVTWPTDFYGGLQPDPTAGYATIITWKLGGDLTGRIASPPMSNHGLTGTPIGYVNPATGTFVTATVDATLAVGGNSTLAGNLTVGNILHAATLNTSGPATLASLAVPGNSTLATLVVSALAALNGGATVPTVGSTDNSTNVANTAWAKTGFVFSAISNGGYIKFPAWLGGFIIQWGRASSGGSSVIVNFPLAFPTNMFVVLPTTAPSIRDSVYVSAFSTTSFTAGTGGSTISIHWIAVGN